MTNITIKLRDGRTVEQVYSDAAIVNGYEPKIKEDFTTDLLTEDEKDNYQYPDGTIEESKKVESFTQEDGSVMYKISYTVEKDNPVSEQDFGKAVVAKSFGIQDAELEGKATIIRAKQEYDV